MTKYAFKLTKKDKKFLKDFVIMSYRVKQKIKADRLQPVKK
jgi:hypothetical protein